MESSTLSSLDPWSCLFRFLVCLDRWKKLSIKFNGVEVVKEKSTKLASKSRRRILRWGDKKTRKKIGQSPRNWWGLRGKINEKFYWFRLKYFWCTAICLIIEWSRINWFVTIPQRSLFKGTCWLMRSWHDCNTLT